MKQNKFRDSWAMALGDDEEYPDNDDDSGSRLPTGPVEPDESRPSPSKGSQAK